MAISQEQKVDFLWKKLGYGVTKTDITTAKSASNESTASPLLLRGDSIWVESDQIPQVKPSSSSEYVQVHDDTVSTSVETQMDVTSEPLRTWKTNLPSWIPAEFGATYQVKIYIDSPGAGSPQTTGTRLYPDGTGNDEWFFDYSSGVLHFIGESLPTAVVNGTTIYVIGARYVGNTGLSNFSASGSGVTAAEYPASQTFVGNGSTVNYTLTHAPSSMFAIDVYVHDVLQRPADNYTVTGTTLQLLDTPEDAADIFVTYRAPFSTSTNYPDESIQNKHLNLTYDSDQYSADGSQIIFDINPGHNAHSVFVIVNGSILPPTEYSVNGTMLTINTIPDVNDIVDIRYMPV